MVHQELVRHQLLNQ